MDRLKILKKETDMRELYFEWNNTRVICILDLLQRIANCLSQFAIFLEQILSHSWVGNPFVQLSSSFFHPLLNLCTF